MFEIFFEKYIGYGLPIVIVDLNSDADSKEVYKKYACEKLKVVSYDSSNLI